MKTIITIFFFFVCSLSFGQPITTDKFIYKGNELKFTALETAGDVPSLTFTSKSYLLWQLNNKNAPFRSFLNAKFLTIETDIAKLKANPGTGGTINLTPILNRLTFLESEVKRLNAETTTLELEGFVSVDSSAGYQKIKLDPKEKGPKRYTQSQRDDLTLAEAPIWTVIINTTTGKINIRAPQGWAAVTSSNIFQ